MEEYENIPRYRTAFRDRPRARGGIGVRRKKRSVKPAFSFRENKRLLQLGCCVLIFLLVLAGRALLPERTAEMRKAVLAVLEHDMDFRAAFASIGEAVSGGEPIRDALSELYISVFGRSAEPEEQNDTIPASGEASAPEHRAQSNTAEETNDTAADEADGGMDIIIPEPVTFQGERKFLSLAAVDTAAFLYPDSAHRRRRRRRHIRYLPTPGMGRQARAQRRRFHLNGRSRNRPCPSGQH
jgi:hypothetical protein